LSQQATTYMINCVYSARVLEIQENMLLHSLISDIHVTSYQDTYGMTGG